MIDRKLLLQDFDKVALSLKKTRQQKIW